VFSNHVDKGEPYPTLTRRAQFLIEHPWFVEAGEDLPVHKDPPAMGGHHPFRMTTGHNRWSIHAMNMANPVLIQTHRGEPHLVVHPEDAAAKGIEDHQPVRVYNDVGSFVVKAKLSPAQRPGGVTIYNGWDPFMFEGWLGSNEVEPGLVKYLGMAGGYGHLRYGPMEWQPVPIDRAINVDIQPA
jgi:anaerobic selenocysteine-containing dehydrogenase